MIEACHASSSPAPTSRSTTCSPSRAAARRSRSTRPRSTRWPRRVRSSTARSPTGPRLRGHDRRRQPQGVRSSPPTGTTGSSSVSTGSRRALPSPTRSCGRPRSGSRTPSRVRRPVARPELASHLVAALNDDRLPEIRTLGSIGQSDLAQMADLADGFLGATSSSRGARRSRSSTRARSRRATQRLRSRTRSCCSTSSTTPGALDLEALGANRNSRPPGDRRRAPVSRACRRRSPASARCSTAARWSARDLQDPLTFRTIAQQNGAAHDAFGFVGSQLAIELNAAQSNPLVVVAEDRVISVGNFEMQPLATALDIARLALAPVISTAAERAVKLLQRNLTGLTEGLGARPRSRRAR